MKKLNLWALLLVLIFVLVTGCKKDEEDPTTPSSNVQYTAADMEGEWLWLLKNGNPLPYTETFWASYHNGSMQYWGLVDGKWESGESTYTVTDNVFKDVSEGDKFNIIYADFLSLVFEETGTTNRYTAQKVLSYEIDPMLIGTWYHDSLATEITFNEDGTCVYVCGDITDYEEFGVCNDFYWYSKEDHTGKMVHYSIDMGESGPEMTQTWFDPDGTMVSYVYYKKMDLFRDLIGQWIWLKKNGEYVPTSQISVAMYLSNGTEIYSTFDDLYHETSNSYSISGNTIYYDIPENPYDNVLFIDDNIMQVQNCDGNEYEALRIKGDNPLQESIVGDWVCDQFTLPNGDVVNIEVQFIASGLITATVGGGTYYGTYQLFDRFLVLHFQQDGAYIRTSFITIEDGVLTQSRLLDDGTILTNMFNMVP